MFGILVFLANRTSEVVSPSQHRLMLKSFDYECSGSLPMSLALDMISEL